MQNETVDISVIVPIYNVEEYLADCLESLLCQGNVSLEVIMIDDGSTDHSGEIAQSYAEQNPCFHYYRIENGGLGHARNYGMQYAAGKYIAFVDSDDKIVDNTYEKMFVLAERNHSELAICNVARFKANKIWSSGIHKKAFNGLLGETHITKCPQLFYDTISCNKLILKDFYIKHHFEFPEGMLYEDIPVIIPMYFLANKVSVLNSVGYLWRVRDGASKSITQCTSGMDNLKDRIKALELLDMFFNENISDQAMHKAKQKKILEVDLMIFINECKSGVYEEVLEKLHIINRYIKKSINMDIIGELSIINQQKYHYVINENVEALVKLYKYQSEKSYKAPVEEKDGELFVQLPDDLFTVKSRNITKEMIEAVPRKYIDKLLVKEDGVIEISAHIYRRRINIRDCSEQTIEAALYDEMTGTLFPLAVFPEKRVELTQHFGEVMDPDSGKITGYNYDGTGFKIIIDLKQLEFTESQSGHYKLLVEYKNRFSEGSIFLGGCDDKSQVTTVARGHEIMANVRFTYLDELQLHIQKINTFLDNVFIEADNIHCVLTAAADALWMKTESSTEKIYFHTVDDKEFYLNKDLFEYEIKYDIYVERGGLEDTPLFCDNRNISLYEGEEFVAIGSSAGTSALSLRLHQHATWMQKISRQNAMITVHTMSAGKTDIVPEGTCAKLYVDDTIAGRQVILAECRCRTVKGQVQCEFQIDFSDEEITKDFYQSLRDVYIAYDSGVGDKINERLYSPRFFSEILTFETLKIRIYRIAEGTVRIGISQLWKKEEDSKEKRDILTYQNYPQYRQEKICSKRILFESMWGSKYSCNPQALYEYIDQNYPEYECIWSLKDARIPIKGHGKRVRRGSQEYYHCLATAKYFVNNVNFENGYVKRKGQIEIQTMHGTPLKTLGLDVASDFPTEESRMQYIQKNKRWNYLIVQGRFVEQKAESMFQFTEKILPVGYPRTDKLFHYSVEQGQNVKKMLGLPMDKKIILYAPTWRVKNRFEMQMDLEQMREHLSSEYVLLIRLHHLSGGYRIPSDGQFVFNVNAYQYVEDLYNIADILITDYSSVMFDYALLNKPMIFFVYDIEEYSEQLRGMYIDFKKEAPGPLVYNTDEIVSVIHNIDAESEKYQSKVEEFKDKFLSYENGESCKRVVKKVLRPKKIWRLKRYLKKHWQSL